MPKLDLDARRAQREATTVVAGGQDFVLSPVLPAGVVVDMMRLADASKDPAKGAQAMQDVFVALFGAKQAEAAMRAVGFDELTDILTEAFGVDLPESLASAKS